MKCALNANENICSTDPFQQTPELHICLKDSKLAESTCRIIIHKIIIWGVLPAVHFTSSRINGVIYSLHLKLNFPPETES